MLILGEDDVRELLPIHECVDVVEALFHEAFKGGTANLSRHRLVLPDGSYQVMAGAVPGLDVAGIKTYISGGRGFRMVVLLYSITEGVPIALMAATNLGALRTGAASGVATRYMAKRDATCVGVIGSGFQARTQLAAVCVARPIERARVFSPTAANRESFAREMSVELGIKVEAVDSAEGAVQEADVVCLVTNSRDPVVGGGCFEAGCHINAVGSNNRTRRELDETAISRSALVVVDDLQDAQLECGELIAAAEHGAFRWEDAVELGAVVSGAIEGRPSPGAITLFESQGIAIEDVAVAAHAHRKALEAGVGRQITL